MAWVNYGHNSQLCHCRRLRGHDATFALILCAAGNFRGSVAGPVVLPVKIGPRFRPRGAADVLPRPVADVLPVVLPARVNSRPVAPRSRPVPVLPTPVLRGRAPGQLPAGCPRSRPVTREALPAPWCCRSRSARRSRPVVLPTCCAPGRLPRAARGVAARATCCACRSTPAGCRCAPARGAADVPRCRFTPCRLPHAPGPSLGKRCRPVVLPMCRAAGQLPAGCPTLPAGHSGSVAGPWCCRSRSAPRCPARGAADMLVPRPVADVLPVVLPARATDVLRCRSTPGRLPHASGRSLGKRCRPVVLPVKIGPTLPARGAADVLRSRPVADVPAFRPRGAAGQLPAGCRAPVSNRGRKWLET